MTPLFIATERFGPSDGDTWTKFIQWAKIPNLAEVVGLDGILCARVVKTLNDEDWKHIVCEDFRLDYFYHLDYLIERVAGVSPRNILGLYRNPETHIDTAPGAGNFVFLGYDLIEESTQISALTNCGGFPEAFFNDELNKFGLITEFIRASEVKRLLSERYPHENHANCEMYAIWRLVESC